MTKILVWSVIGQKIKCDLLLGPSYHHPLQNTIGITSHAKYFHIPSIEKNVKEKAMWPICQRKSNVTNWGGLIMSDCINIAAKLLVLWQQISLLPENRGNYNWFIENSNTVMKEYYQAEYIFCNTSVKLKYFIQYQPSWFCQFTWFTADFLLCRGLLHLKNCVRRSHHPRHLQYLLAEYK